MNRQQHIVITGLGLIASLGSDPHGVFEAVLAGRSGIGPMSALEQPPKPDKGGGQAVDLPPDFEPNLPRVVRYLRFAARQALRDAGPLPYSPQRRSACFGTTLHGMPAGGKYIRSGDTRDLEGFLAGAVLARALSGFNLRGAAVTTCSACASGLASVGVAATLLRSRAADLVLAGGYDGVSEYVYGGFDSLRLIASGAPLPFAGGRDGMKVAEGYAAIVLEREEDALARGARIFARVAGVGESSDAFHLTQPQPEGLGAARAIRAALERAGLIPQDVDMIAAHATSTPSNDAAEYAALASVFADHLSSVPVTAFKSHLGHTLGGAGAVELALSALCRLRGLVPPVAHREPPDTAFTDLRLVQGAPHARSVQTTMNLSLGFGGSNACVVLSDKPSHAVFTQPHTDEPVITGVGVVVPGGVGNAAFLRLLEGSDAPRGGSIDDDLVAELVNTRRARRISGYSRLTLAATSAACQDAGVRTDSAYLAVCSAMLGTAHGSSPFCEAYYTQIVQEGIIAANPVLFAEGVPNAAAAQVSLMLGLTGGCQTFIGTRTAGLEALRLAALRIAEGETDRVLVGAAEEHSSVVNRAYDPCGLFDDPTAGPWLTGSGAVTLVLEGRRTAEARGAHVYGVIGSGASASGDLRTAVRTTLEGIGPTPLVISALSDVRPDRAAAVEIGRRDTEHWSIRKRLPELFSAGPLAALGAWLLGSGPSHRREASVLATDFGGLATAVRVVRFAPPVPVLVNKT